MSCGIAQPAIPISLSCSPLYLQEDVNEESVPSSPPRSRRRRGKSGGLATGEPLEVAKEDEEPFDEQKVLEEARRKLSEWN